MGRIEWLPIEGALDVLPFQVIGSNKLFKSYDSCLVYGPTWEGGWDHNWPGDGGDFWTGEPRIAMASTYEGQGFWTIDSDAPSDYDMHIQPTHFAEINAPEASMPGFEG